MAVTGATPEDGVLAPAERGNKIALRTCNAMSDQIPKEARIISLLLANSAVTECEPKVVSFLMEFIQSILVHPHYLALSTRIIHESLICSDHAGRTNVTLADVRLGIASNSRRFQGKTPSRMVSLLSSFAIVVHE
jgi:Transcription initiation factor IID TAFII31 subunit